MVMTLTYGVSLCVCVGGGGGGGVHFIRLGGGFGRVIGAGCSGRCHFVTR